MRHIRPVTVLVVAALALAAVGCGGDDDDASEATTTTEEPAETDEGGDRAGPAVDPYDGHTSDVYDDPSTWICRPDLDDDVCRDLDVTTLAADGERSVEARAPAEEPPIDCFYVYPTVSADPGTNSDLEVAPGDSEEQTVVAQAAQYARSCRVFAPVYRQVTLAALSAGEFGEGREVAYADVVDAWKTYVSQHSDGRGVILIGHSQPAGVLTQLIAEEIDGVDGVQDRLVAAHLLGTSVQVAEGELAGGDFSEIPGCTAADETGCVVSFSSYPADSPPPEDALFARSTGGGTEALCTDPLALLGRDRGTTVAPTQGSLLGGFQGAGDFETRFVSMPDAVDVSCEDAGDFDYLGVSLADPDDPRPVGFLVEQNLGPTWGLHLLDMTHVLDDLVDLAAEQGAAYAGG